MGACEQSQKDLFRYGYTNLSTERIYLIENWFERTLYGSKYELNWLFFSIKREYVGCLAASE